MTEKEIKQIISYIKRLVEAETKKAVKQEFKKLLTESTSLKLRDTGIVPVKKNVQRIDPIAKQTFTGNPILNEMLQQTAVEGKWLSISNDASAPPAAYLHNSANYMSTEMNEIDDYVEESNIAIPDMESFMHSTRSDMFDNNPIQQPAIKPVNIKKQPIVSNIPDFLKTELNKAKNG